MMKKAQINKVSLEFVAVAVLLLLAALVFTWPLAAYFKCAIPQGSEPAAVAMFQFFTMRWTGMSLDHGLSYWDAPFFYPFRGAFAWCEPQLLSAIFVWAVSKLFGYTAAYNLMLLAYMVLMGMGGYVFAKLLTADRTAAFLSALWLCSGAFALQQICAPALLASGFAFFCIVSLILFHMRQQRRYFWLTLFCFLAVFFTHKQSALYLTLLFPAVSWPWLRQLKRPGRALIRCAIGVAFVLLATLPYGLKQWTLTSGMGFEHALSDVRAGLSFRQLFMPAHGHWLFTHILKQKGYSWDISIVSFSLIVAACWQGMCRQKVLDRQYSNIILALCSLLAVSFILAAGTLLPFYRFLFDRVPGMGFIRAPARSMVFAIFAVSLLSCLAFAWLRGRFSSAWPRRVFTFSVFALLCAEMWTMPIRLIFPSEETAGHQPLIDWLSANDPGAALLEVPLQKANSDLEASAMLRMLEHRHPLINGYATFVPTAYRQLKAALISDLPGKGLRFARAYAAKYILLHRHLIAQKDQDAYFAIPSAERVYEDKDHVILRLDPRYIEEGEIFFPFRADFRDKIPAQGSIYATRLNKPLSRAFMIDMSRSRQLRISWLGPSGERREQTLFLRGSAILDAGDDRFFYRIKRFSPSSGSAEAVLTQRPK